MNWNNISGQERCVNRYTADIYGPIKIFFLIFFLFCSFYFFLFLLLRLGFDSSLFYCLFLSVYYWCSTASADSQQLRPFVVGFQLNRQVSRLDLIELAPSKQRASENRSSIDRIDQRDRQNLKYPKESTTLKLDVEEAFQKPPGNP